MLDWLAWGVGATHSREVIAFSASAALTPRAVRWAACPGRKSRPQFRHGAFVELLRLLLLVLGCERSAALGSVLTAGVGGGANGQVRVPFSKGEFNQLFLIINSMFPSQRLAQYIVRGG